MTALVHTKRHEQILVVTIDNSPANAISYRTSRELYAAFAAFQEDDSLRVAILTGAGDRIFCGGWDLKEAGESVSADLYYDPQVGNGPGGFGGIAEFWGLTKPVIAAVNGSAAGGGFEITLACDMIVAAEHARFVLPETRLGILPAAGGIQNLHRRMPYNIAMHLMMTGEPISATEAARWGLVNEVVPQGESLAAAIRHAERICESGPLAIEGLKEIMRHTSHLSAKDGFAAARNPPSGLKAYRAIENSEDSLEGPRSFLEKRRPRWRGK
ncbi:enoyl-CoA hydratase-related protein [Mesorhizobium sp. M0036]|uniref:enoyl-CoA hydratase-related protein n=1 Tax=Mesorhizobium sp. M0036 TaxID=2956853 RepID=UPI00333CB880